MMKRDWFERLRYAHLWVKQSPRELRWCSAGLAIVACKTLELAASANNHVAVGAASLSLLGLIESIKNRNSYLSVYWAMFHDKRFAKKVMLRAHEDMVDIGGTEALPSLCTALSRLGHARSFSAHIHMLTGNPFIMTGPRPHAQPAEVDLPTMPEDFESAVELIKRETLYDIVTEPGEYQRWMYAPDESRLPDSLQTYIVQQYPELVALNQSFFRTEVLEALQPGLMTVLQCTAGLEYSATEQRAAIRQWQAMQSNGAEVSKDMMVTF